MIGDAELFRKMEVCQAKIKRDSKFSALAPVTRLNLFCSYICSQLVFLGMINTRCDVMTCIYRSFGFLLSLILPSSLTCPAAKHPSSVQTLDRPQDCVQSVAIPRDPENNQQIVYAMTLDQRREE